MPLFLPEEALWLDNGLVAQLKSEFLAAADRMSQVRARLAFDVTRDTVFSVKFDKCYSFNVFFFNLFFFFYFYFFFFFFF